MWDCTENQIELILIRHGKTKGNEERRYLGRGEESLSKAGRRELSGRAYPALSMVFGSPMIRCRQTAELLYPNLPCHIIEEWREIDFGKFEGKNHEELKGDRDYIDWMESGGALPFPGGESREAFLKRCCAGMEKLLAYLSKEGTEKNLPIGAVVHGGTIMALLSRYGAEGDYFSYQCENGDGYRCKLCFSSDLWGRAAEESIRITEICPLFP